jgi:site-specific DNA-methyltransferase (adenine-specific)
MPHPLGIVSGIAGDKVGGLMAKLGPYELNSMVTGDCLDVMRGFPDNCIDSIITDPPYGLQFMGKDWDYGLPGVPYWREALRVAKPGATLLAFGGSRTYHRLTCAIEDAGWKIRDCISYFHDGTQAERAFMASLSEEQLGAYLELHHPGAGMGWVYGSGIGLGHNVSKGIDKAAGAEREVVGRDEIFLNRNPNNTGAGRIVTNGDGTTKDGRKKPYQKSTITAPATPLAAKFDGWNTRLKPAHEPIVLATKPIDGTFAANAEKWGVSGIWVDGARIPSNDFEPKERIGATKLIEDGPWQDRQKQNGRPTIIEGNTKGRWPANVIHDGSEEVMAEFDKAGVRTSGSRKGGSGYKLGIYEGQKGHWGLKNNYPCEASQGSAARYFAQCPPDPTAHPDAARFHYCPKAGKRERGQGNNHPTVKPLSLLRYLAKLTRPPDGGIVLDPFAGSGTTALACIAEGRAYILIEKEPKYVVIARQRVANAQPPLLMEVGS